MTITTPSGFKIGPPTPEIRGVSKNPLALNNPVDEPILKSFEVVRANTGRLDLVYKNASHRETIPSKYGVTFGQFFQQMKYLGSRPSTFIEITKTSKLSTLVIRKKHI